MSFRERAQSMIELVVGLAILVPIVLILIDIGTLIIGSAMNSDICREAARAAANGAPDQVITGTPRARAEAVINRKKQMESGNVSLKTPIRMWEQLREPLPSAPFGGPVDGEVTVQTTATVRPPFLVRAIVPNGVDLVASQSYPYTWIMPPDSDLGSSGGSSGGGGITGGGYTTGLTGRPTGGGSSNSTGRVTGGMTGGNSGGMGSSSGGQVAPTHIF